MNDNSELLRKKREAIRKRLAEGKPVVVGKSGEVDETGQSNGLVIPDGKLASEDLLKKKREAIRKRLAEGKPVIIKKSGHVSTDAERSNDSEITIPPGKLAHSFQWYHRDPELLEAEKLAMSQFFPQFELKKLDDGRIYWIGSLGTGILGDNTWYLMLVYDNDHPRKVMGGSVRVYTIDPDIEDLIEELGWQPHHLLRDSEGSLYLCTAEAENIHDSKSLSTSAATTLSWAVKWLVLFEMVLSGDLTPTAFDGHDY